MKNLLLITLFTTCAIIVITGLIRNKNTEEQNTDNSFKKDNNKTGKQNKYNNFENVNDNRIEIKGLIPKIILANLLTFLIIWIIGILILILTGLSFVGLLNTLKP